jgi:hypothetical protein
MLHETAHDLLPLVPLKQRHVVASESPDAKAGHTRAECRDVVIHDWPNCTATATIWLRGRAVGCPADGTRDKQTLGPRMVSTDSCLHKLASPKKYLRSCLCNCAPARHPKLPRGRRTPQRHDCVPPLSYPPAGRAPQVRHRSLPTHPSLTASTSAPSRLPRRHDSCFPFWIFALRYPLSNISYSYPSDLASGDCAQ